MQFLPISFCVEDPGSRGTPVIAEAIHGVVWYAAVVNGCGDTVKSHGIPHRLTQDSVCASQTSVQALPGSLSPVGDATFGEDLAVEEEGSCCRHGRG